MPSQIITGSKFIFLSILGLLFIMFPAFAGSWKTLQPGIEYQDINHSYLTLWSHIHSFRIDLTKYQLQLVLAKDLAKKNAFISEYAAFGDGLITLNGGFFDKNALPLGLRISQKQLLSPLKNISWWGVFYIKNNRAHVTHKHQFSQHQVDFAIQSGPRLLIKGQIPHLKTGTAERSALGITQDGKLIIVVTENSSLTLKELAILMQSDPLRCKDALNLDGGSSSQLMTHIPPFDLSVQGFSPLSDAVVVKSKTVPQL